MEISGFSMSKKFTGLLPYIFVFVASLYQPWDADLGWHLKYGEYFFENGRILKENTFATQMPDFIWANTSWGVDLIYYCAFALGGFLGLTLLGALVVTLTFYFFSKAFELSLWQKAFIFPLLVILESPVNEISFRGQIFSVMMLGILFWILSVFQKKRNVKTLLWLILLFLIWANIHGQFILGLGILILWISVNIFSKFAGDNFPIQIKNFLPLLQVFLKANLKEIGSLVLIVLLSIGATLIHPFGFGIYSDAFLHFNNRELQNIMEYLPFDELSQPWWNQMIFGIFIFLGLIYLFFDGKIKQQIPNLGVLSVLYGLSWWVRRYAWSMYYLGIPLLKPLADFIRPDSEKRANTAALLLFIFYTACAIYIKMPLSQFSGMNWDIYCAAYNNCSPKAVEFVRDNNLSENLLSLYGWGGYMIWNYPEVKPSIDGRMHLWVDDSGYSAFSDYYSLEQNIKDVDKSKYRTVLMWKDKPVYNRLNELVEEGKWELQYEDDLAGVFVRINQ